MKKNLAIALACVLAFQGCGLDKVEVPQSLVGPSELGISLEMRALPDVLVADGIQTSVIQAVVRNQNGQPAVGREIVFYIFDESGNIAEIGQFTNAAGARVYGSTTIATNSNGIAQVVYTTPERRDFTANARIVIGARPVGTDANGAPITTLRIELRSAEPRRFPQIPGNASPNCGFNVAPNNPINKEGTVLRFSSTANDPDGYIVRYEWYFGDGTSSTGAEGLIDVQKGYPLAGNYTATHIVTDNAGAQTACFLPIVIVP
jgi:PKD domain